MQDTLHTDGEPASRKKLRLYGAAIFTALMLGAGAVSVAHAQHDDSHWNEPRGYGDFYHENGRANPAARQGYEAGFGQGESDARGHHSYRPTHVDTYKHVPDSPGDHNRGDFVRAYREAFMHGYAKGYGR